MNKKVEIYSTKTCHYCDLAKEWFNNNNINYINYDVTVDAEKRKEMIEITGQMGVPVIKVENDIVIGFDRETLSKILNIN